MKQIDVRLTSDRQLWATIYENGKRIYIADYDLSKIEPDVAVRRVKALAKRHGVIARIPFISR